MFYQHFIAIEQISEITNKYEFLFSLKIKY